jgi:hypothetical protein
MTYYFAFFLGACLGVYLLSLLCRGIVSLFERIIGAELDPFTKRFGSIGCASLFAYFISGYGNTDGGMPNWSDSWIYLAAGVIVTAFAFRKRLNREPNHISGNRTAIKGAAIVSVLLGAAAVHAIAYQGSYPPPDRVVGLFAASEHVDNMRAGFEEVSSDWHSFAKIWAFADPMVFDSLENEAMIRFSTMDELREIYRFRATYYEAVAGDASRNSACGLHRPLEDVLHILDDLRTESNVRQVGRALARQHESYPAWRPPTELPLGDAEREAFRAYVDNTDINDLRVVLDAVAQGKSVSNEAMCLAQAAIYLRAADRPNDVVGDLRLFDYVRSLEASALASAASSDSHRRP